MEFLGQPASRDRKVEVEVVSLDDRLRGLDILRVTRSMLGKGVFGGKSDYHCTHTRYQRDKRL